jgi:FtsH-binding integral membrane protein
MLEILAQIHGFLRWPVLLLALAGLVWSLGPRGKSDPARIDRILAGAFVGLLDVQVLLGLVLFVLAGEDRGSHVGHAAVMLGAVLVAHVLSRRVRKATPVAGRRDVVMLFVVPFVAVVVGLFLLPAS